MLNTTILASAQILSQNPVLEMSEDMKDRYFSCLLKYSTFPADISKQSLYKCGLRVHPFGHFTFNAGCDIC